MSRLTLSAYAGTEGDKEKGCVLGDWIVVWEEECVESMEGTRLTLLFMKDLCAVSVLGLPRSVIDVLRSSVHTTFLFGDASAVWSPWAWGWVLEVDLGGGQ